MLGLQDSRRYRRTRTARGQGKVVRNFLKMVILCLGGILMAACSGTAPDLTVASSPQERTASIFGHKTAARDITPANISYKGKLRVVKVLPPPPETQGGRIQLLSPNDVLEVTFFGIDKLNREVRVDATGKISMPLIGSVQAAGKTVRQLERDLERLYGRSYLQNPQITINVKESFGQRATVDGEVRKPGIYPVTPRSTLLQLLSQAQGFTQIGDPSKVFIFRDMSGQRYVAQYNAEAIRAGKMIDPRIYGGDIIVTFPSTAKVAMENLRNVLGIATSAGRLAVLP